MKYRKYIQSYAEALGDLIFPPKTECIICKNSLTEKDRSYICAGCRDQLPFVPQGRWIQSGVLLGTESMRMFSVFEYQGDIVKLIFRLKYQHQTYLARILGRMMALHIQRERLNIDLMIPVPLYQKRHSQRGFNQSALLSKYIAMECQVDTSLNNLIRIKSTRVMHQLSRLKRRQNVKDAFALKKPHQVMGLNILLIDDILTTGSTVEACGKLLLEAGAKSVTVFTLARSLKKNV